MSAPWAPGDVVVRREVLGLGPADQCLNADHEWMGKAWMAVPVFVVEDSDEALITYIAPGAEFGFPEGVWPSPNGVHPWSGRHGWVGHGALMVQRPGDHHAVWHFWSGPDREFACWYINLQTSFVRTSVGYDTQDLELDIVVLPDGSWSLKDLDVLPERVAEGRFSPQLVEWIVSLGHDLTAELEAGRRWWDDRWVDWRPEAGWDRPSLPAQWREAVPSA
jgi:hypothetical protein